MITREELTAKRLKWAMRPINLYGQLFIPTTFCWRIEAILGASKWEQVEAKGFVQYYNLDFIDFLMLGKWGEDEES